MTPLAAEITQNQPLPCPDKAFWQTASAAEIAHCLDRGVNVNATAGFWDTPLHWVVRRTDADAVEALKMILDAGANVHATDYYGLTPLHHMAGREEVGPGTAESVNMLVAYGADIDARDKRGETPLHSAAMWGTPEMAKALIDAGADVNALGAQQGTPLHDAAHFAKADMVKLLIDNGADFRLKESYAGATPLHEAVKVNSRKHNTETVIVLLDAGADIEVEDNRGKTPLDEAKNWSTAKTVKVLESTLARRRMAAEKFEITEQTR